MHGFLVIRDDSYLKYYKQYRAQDEPWYRLGAHKNFEYYLLLTPNPFEIGHGNSLHKLMFQS